MAQLAAQRLERRLQSRARLEIEHAGERELHHGALAAGGTSASSWSNAGLGIGGTGEVEL